MEANKSKSVTFKIPSSIDLQYSQSSATPELSSGHRLTQVAMVNLAKEYMGN